MSGSQTAAGEKNETLQLQQSHDEVGIDGQAIYCETDKGSSFCKCETPGE
jgi:hypothetical protein